MKTLLGLEIRRKINGTAWWVLLGIWVLLVGGISAMFVVAARSSFFGDGPDRASTSAAAYSVLLCVQLVLLGVIVPAFSGTSINGDRDSGVLAQIQITTISHRSIVMAKWLAATLVSIVFFLITSPVLFYFIWAAKLSLGFWILTPVGLIVEIMVFAAIGTGFSGIVRRPVFSVLYTYLLVAALALGAPLLSVVLTVSTAHVETVTHHALQSTTQSTTNTCVATEKQERVYHWERYWWLLSPNPVVLVADMLPSGQEHPMTIARGMHIGLGSLQTYAQDQAHLRNQCSGAPHTYGDTTNRIPAWPFGVSTQGIIAVGLMAGAFRGTRTPIRRLGKGQRIA